jgi:hypothetical protein
MIGDVSSTKSLKLIGDISEEIEGLLHIFIVEPLESIEEISQNINSGVTLSGYSLIDFGEPVPDQLRSFQSTHSSILAFVQMTTYDILCLRVQLLESLHVSGVDAWSHSRDSILNDEPEIVVNSLKMHSHLVLPIGIVCAIEDGARNGYLDHTCGRHN